MEAKELLGKQWLTKWKASTDGNWKVRTIDAISKCGSLIHLKEADLWCTVAELEFKEIAMPESKSLLQRIFNRR